MGECYGYELTVNEEAGQLRTQTIVRTPTQKEVDDHNITHRRYRTLCPRCIAGGLTHDRHLDREYTEGSRGVH